jgi:hypothetical protein
MKEKHLLSTLALPYTLSPKRLLSAAKEQRSVKTSAISVNVHERCEKNERAYGAHGGIDLTCALKGGAAIACWGKANAKEATRVVRVIAWSR